MPNKKVVIENGLTLIKAVQKRNIKVIKELIAAGTYLNVRDNNGWTALIYAAFSGYEEGVRVLISAGANVNVIGTNKYTALKLAEDRGFTNIVNLLKSSGAE